MGSRAQAHTIEPSDCLWASCHGARPLKDKSAELSSSKVAEPEKSAKSAIRFHRSHRAGWIREMADRFAMQAGARVDTCLRLPECNLDGQLLLTLTILILSIQRSPSPEMQLFYSVCCGVGMVISMILDCLDGMQARKTGQCSKLGEVLDHALDAISIPISVASVGFSAHMFETSPIPVALGLVLSVCVYNAQLVLYHHTGKFIHPDVTTGTEGQFGLAVTHVAFGIVEYCLKRNSMPLTCLFNVGWLYCVITCIVSFRVLWFYIVRLYPMQCLTPHLVFHVYTSVALYLFFTGWLDAVAFSILVSVLSFRICGTYVIRTCVKMPFHGYDRACLFLVLLAVLDSLRVLEFDQVFEGTVLVGSKANAFLLCFCVWVVARHIYNLAEHYDDLKPKAKASA